jgi:hypothetical protein
MGCNDLKALEKLFRAKTMTKSFAITDNLDSRKVGMRFAPLSFKPVYFFVGRTFVG